MLPPQLWNFILCEEQALQHVTKLYNCWGKIVESKALPILSLIPRSTCRTILSMFTCSKSHEICTQIYHTLFLIHHSTFIHVNYLSIFFRVASLALGQSYDCPRASEVTLNDMGKIKAYQTTSKHNSSKFLGCTIRQASYIYFTLISTSCVISFSRITIIENANTMYIISFLQHNLAPKGPITKHTG